MSRWSHGCPRLSVRSARRSLISSPHLGAPSTSNVSGAVFCTMDTGQLPRLSFCATAQRGNFDDLTTLPMGHIAVEFDRPRMGSKRFCTPGGYAGSLLSLLPC